MKRNHVTLKTFPFGYSTTHLLVLANINLQTKFHVSSFTQIKDMSGDPELKKRSRDQNWPWPRPLRVICHSKSPFTRYNIWMFVYTIQPVVQPVVKPIWQQVVSYKRGLRLTHDVACLYTKLDDSSFSRSRIMKEDQNRETMGDLGWLVSLRVIRNVTIRLSTYDFLFNFRGNYSRCLSWTASRAYHAIRSRLNQQNFVKHTSTKVVRLSCSVLFRYFFNEKVFQLLQNKQNGILA